MPPRHGLLLLYGRRELIIHSYADGFGRSLLVGIVRIHKQKHSVVIHVMDCLVNMYPGKSVKVYRWHVPLNSLKNLIRTLSVVVT